PAALVAIALDLRDRVELAHVPARIGEGGDRPRVVQEGPGILDERLETELVHDVLFPVPVVVDQDLVEDLVSELEEVRPARGLLEGDEVREDRHFGRVGGIDEKVMVRVIRDRILRNRRGIAVVGRRGYYMRISVDAGREVVA